METNLWGLSAFIDLSWVEYYFEIKVLTMNKQIIPEVFTLGCIYYHQAYRDLMREEGPKHIPIV